MKPKEKSKNLRETDGLDELVAAAKLPTPNMISAQQILKQYRNGRVLPAAKPTKTQLRKGK